MDCCVGVIILIVLIFGVSIIYGLYSGMNASQKQTERAREWAQTLRDYPLPELEMKREQLERQINTLQKERLLASGQNLNKINMELAECNQRMLVVKTFIKAEAMKTINE